MSGSERPTGRASYPQPCWFCRKAVPLPDDPEPCPWAEKGEPVPGWLAVPEVIHEKLPDRIKELSTFRVMMCPMYKPG